MLSEKLNTILNKHEEASKEFWAGKPKLTESEKQAVVDFAKRIGDPLDKAIGLWRLDGGSIEF